MGKKQRLTGIDLLRSLAIYAVVILHSDEGILVKPMGWTAISQFSGFAVPFFLATSFYLIINKLYISGSHYPWKTRLTRLLIPYGFWSLVYLLQKSIRYLLKHENDKLIHLFQDPVSIIFFGGSAFHLYFIPLLLSGTLLIKSVDFLIKRLVKPSTIIVALLVSTFAYEILLLSGNSFQISASIGFQKLVESTIPTANQNPMLRILLGELSLIIRCLPYIFMAMLLNHHNISKKLLQLNTYSTLVLGFIFITLNIYGNLFIPESLYEITRGYTTLLFAISVSTNLKENDTIKNLGSCSFGIYLLHLLLVEVFQSMGNKFYAVTKIPVSTLTLLTSSVLIFIISWAATNLLMKKKSVAKLVFGA